MRFAPCFAVADRFHLPVYWETTLNLWSHAPMISAHVSRRLKRALGSIALCLGIILPTGTVLCLGSDGHLALELAALGACADKEKDAAPTAEITADVHCAGSCLDTKVGTAEFKTGRSSTSDDIVTAHTTPSLDATVPPVSHDKTDYSSRSISHAVGWVRPFHAALHSAVALC